MTTVSVTKHSDNNILGWIDFDGDEYSLVGIRGRVLPSLPDKERHNLVAEVQNGLLSGNLFGSAFEYDWKFTQTHVQRV